MFISHASPSSISTYQECPFKYFLKYILGLKDTAGPAALKGKIVHRVFEVMAKLRLRGKEIDPLWLLDRSFDYYTKLEPDKKIRKTTSRGEAADYRKLREAVEMVVNDPYYNPYNLKIIGAEALGKIHMDKDGWSCPLPGAESTPFEVTGIIDLIHELDEDTIEVIDWKTGEKKDWVTGRPIDTYELLQQIQPRIYHWMIGLLYPQYKNILVTFYYTKENGPEMLSFSQEDMSYTMEFVYRFLNTVRKDMMLKRRRSWRCSKMCHFGKLKLCEQIYSDLHTEGYDYVIREYTGLTLQQQLEL
jgi:hypothetical protein